MIEGWRLCRAVHTELTGEGARLVGGRWNSRGRAMVYLADHPALCVLDVRVHLDLPMEDLPDDYVLLRVHLPDAPVDELAAVPDDPRAAGDAWLREGRGAVLRVPSVLVPPAWNLLLNPMHPRGAEASIAGVIPFGFDARL